MICMDDTLPSKFMQFVKNDVTKEKNNYLAVIIKELIESVDSESLTLWIHRWSPLVGMHLHIFINQDVKWWLPDKQ